MLPLHQIKIKTTIKSVKVMEITFKNSTFIVLSVLFVFWLALAFYDGEPHVNAVLFYITFLVGVLVATWAEEKEWKNKWLNKHTTLF